MNRVKAITPTVLMNATCYLHKISSARSQMRIVMKTRTTIKWTHTSTRVVRLRSRWKFLLATTIYTTERGTRKTFVSLSSELDSPRSSLTNGSGIAKRKKPMPSMQKNCHTQVWSSRSLMFRQVKTWHRRSREFARLNQSFSLKNVKENE